MEQLSDNRKKIREAFRSGQINAICGYPGIGKTPVVMVRCTRVKTNVRI